ncbi:type III pantothenate kinase [Larkinella soli]|uniref:type III pantothenate kinase n=1 Tax=Larkinella soli TaxID=1770527 RepID=UPI000FFB0C26|nr:type III pantothenate kinase [Larkinella soli]
MQVAIDWGNSAVKAGFFENGRLLEAHHRLTVEALERLLRRQTPEAVVVSSTNRPADQLRSLLNLPADTFWLNLNGTTPVPVEKDYDTPQTLGSDRVAAAVGAGVLYPKETSLVIDLGTCITYDLVDADSVFHGGMISPGFRMRFRAMHEFTERLPLVEPGESRPPLLGKNTRQAMEGGVVNGLMAELNGIIEAHRHEHPDIRILLCGGDAPFFQSGLKPPFVLAPDVVLLGLNRILDYNR